MVCITGVAVVYGLAATVLLVLKVLDSRQESR